MITSTSAKGIGHIVAKKGVAITQFLIRAPKLRCCCSVHLVWLPVFSKLASRLCYALVLLLYVLLLRLVEACQENSAGLEYFRTS